jgi:hypothetical protein
MADSYRLSDQEYAAISQLQGSERYKHFVKRVTDWQAVWGLRNEFGWVSAADGFGNDGFAVWPHSKYAMACATGEWGGNHPAPIDVHEFVESWLPNMANQNVQVAVFPTKDLKGVMVLPLTLQEDLRKELAQYE